MKISYPQYLLSIGFVPYRKIVTKTGFEYKQTTFDNNYSTMGNGMLDYRFKKDEIEICWGLHEFRKPPTIAHEIFESDDEMNQFILDHSNEEIHEMVLGHLSRKKITNV